MDDDDSTPSVAAIWKTIVYLALTLLAIPASAALAVALIVFLWHGDREAAVHFLLFGLLLGGVSFSVWRWFPRPLHALLSVNSAGVAMGWILAAIVCTAPIYSVCRTQAATNETTRKMASPLNALYESTSSISNGGLTCVQRSSQLPPAIQLWRSVCQWIGGVGLAVFALLIIDPSETGSSIYEAETRSWQPRDDPRGNVMRVILLYVGLTVLCALAFALAGMDPWENLNHSLIISSTGGLTVRDDSFTSYSVTIQCIAAATMLLATISFGTLYLGLTGHWKRVCHRTDLRGLTVWLSGLLAIFLLAALGRGSTDGRDSAFNVVSAVSTCGASSGELSQFAITSVWLLMVAMFVGGCGDSTASGLKLNRVIWTTKVACSHLRKNLGLESEEHHPQWNGNDLDQREADLRTARIHVLLFIFTMTLAIGFLGLRLAYEEHVSSDRVLFQATSAVSVTGLSMDLSGPDRPAAAKIIEMVLMLAGRLEIIAMLLLFPVVAGRVRRVRPS